MEIKRLLSLDAFRGFTIAAMILVNFPGNGEQVFLPLSHTKWWGISPTDLIAPFFLFIVGVSIAFAYTKRLASGVAPSSMYQKLIIRAFKIYAVGMFLNLFSLLPDMDIETLRFTGTLHRIAVVFLVCGMIFLNTKWKTQAFIGTVLLLGYWFAMVIIPTPGYDKAMLEPGINLAAWVDSKLLPGAMYQGTWDPEGIFSTIPSIVTGISGMLVGKLLLGNRTIQDNVIILYFSGFISFIIGIIMNWSFPLNENLWSSSFVLLTSGLACTTLASCIYILDIKKYETWAKFGIIYGMNAISVYVLADFFAVIFYTIPFGNTSLNMHFFNGLTSIGIAPKIASMFYALLYVFVVFIPALILFRKKIFIKL